ncbi:MAG: arginase family protein [Microbacteriaceae bacterium]|jgi:arginase|nr:arginase family protein [Microbacteriaceae bacterium]
MRLIDGVEAISGDLPTSSTLTVEVPPGAGSSLGSAVHRLSSIQYVRDELRATLQDASSPPITIGGDCGVELAAIEHAIAGGDTLVVWIDAHADLNTPATSPSGAFHGMVLRTLLGDGPPELVPATPLRPDRVILAGARALDDAESEFVEASGIRMIGPESLTPSSLREAMDASGARSVYLHVDLDVLDPAEFECVSYPEPFGISVQALLALIAEAKSALPLAGAGLMEFAPASAESAADDMPTILRIVGALARRP